MSYNPHVIGRELLARERARADTVSGGLKPPRRPLSITSDRSGVD